MIVKIHVKTSSGKQEVEKKDGFYLVSLKSVPENNKANLELEKVLKKYFGGEIKIKSGFTSKKKMVEVVE